jgi:hypothetical protein
MGSSAVRLTIVPLLLGCALAWPTSARADAPDKATCAAAYADGQRLYRRQALRAARGQLLLCARDPCPKILQPDCGQWLDTVERELPSIVLVARHADGRDESALRVFVDEQLVAERLEGRAIELDPGVHSLRFEAADRPSWSMSVIANAGEKGRILVIPLDSGAALVAPSATDAHEAVGGPRRQSGPTRWPAWVLGGVGVAAAGSFAYFGLSGVSARDDLARCRGSCAPSAVDAVRARFIGADVSLGVSVVALGLAAYFFFAHDRGVPPAPQAVLWRVGPAGVGLSF